MPGPQKVPDAFTPVFENARYKYGLVGGAIFGEV